MRNHLLYIVLIIFCLACSNEYTPSPQQEKNVPVVLGEIAPHQEIKVTLTNAKNITYPNYQSSNIFKEVVLLDNLGNKLDKFTLQEKELWKSNYKAQSDTEYTLQFKYENKNIKAKTIIPSDFSAKILEEKYAGDTLHITLSIENRLKNSYFVIESWQFSIDNYSKLLFTNNDSFTDNKIYGELYSPFNRLFVRTSTDLQLPLKILKKIYPSSSRDEFVEVRVKSVTPDYYDYLYNYELQLQGEEIYLPKKNKYLGIWGGCNTQKLQIFLNEEK